LAEADFEGARKALEQSMAVRKGGENKVILRETQMELADLSLEQGRAPSDAETTARQAIEDFNKEKARDDEALAWALLARSLCAQQKFEEAKHAAAQALSLSEKSPNFEIRMDNAIVAARVGVVAPSASYNSSERKVAPKQLASIVSVARRLGYFGIELEARLLLCEIEAENNPAAAHLHAEGLKHDAQSRGFELIARKAQAIEAAAQAARHHA
jgi:tetratricopeptide (TPR) repeat protein